MARVVDLPGQTVGATAFAVSLAVAIGSIALSQLKERAKQDGYEFVTVYRWKKDLEPREFTIGEKDPDGYLSVWKDLASQRRTSYNVPMLAMFKLPRRAFDEGSLVWPYVAEIDVLHNPLDDLRDPNRWSHYSFAYFGQSIPFGNGFQGDIPDRLSF